MGAFMLLPGAAPHPDTTNIQIRNTELRPYPVRLKTTGIAPPEMPKWSAVGTSVEWTTGPADDAQMLICLTTGMSIDLATVVDLPQVFQEVELGVKLVYVGHHTRDLMIKPAGPGNRRWLILPIAFSAFREVSHSPIGHVHVYTRRY
jgi:hypothetical protein